MSLRTCFAFNNNSLSNDRMYPKLLNGNSWEMGSLVVGLPAHIFGFLSFFRDENGIAESWKTSGPLGVRHSRRINDGMVGRGIEVRWATPLVRSVKFDSGRMKVRLDPGKISWAQQGMTRGIICSAQTWISRTIRFNACSAAPFY